MTLREANPELSVRWSEWTLCHNRRGVHDVLRGALFIFPAFGVFDLLFGTTRAQAWSCAVCGALTLLTLASLPAVSGDWFRRHPNAISAGYVVLVSLGIGLATAFMGGAASPLSCCLSLVIVASGVFFVWPRRVLLAAYAAIVLGSLSLELSSASPPGAMWALASQLLLVSTAVVSAAGQLFSRRSQRQLESATLKLQSELGKGSEFIVRVPSSIGYREAAS